MGFMWTAGGQTAVVIWIRNRHGLAVRCLGLQWTSRNHTTFYAGQPFADIKLGRRVGPRDNCGGWSTGCRASGVVSDEADRTRAKRSRAINRHRATGWATITMSSISRRWGSRDRFNIYGRWCVREHFNIFTADSSRPIFIIHHWSRVCRWWRATTELRIDHSCAHNVKPTYVANTPSKWSYTVCSIFSCV